MLSAEGRPSGAGESSTQQKTGRERDEETGRERMIKEDREILCFRLHKYKMNSIR